MNILFCVTCWIISLRIYKLSDNKVVVLQMFCLVLGTHTHLLLWFVCVNTDLLVEILRKVFDIVLESSCSNDRNTVAPKLGTVTSGHRVTRSCSVKKEKPDVIVSSHKCNKCLRTYSKAVNLKRHLRFECGVEPQFSCPYCPHKSKLKENLKKHILIKHKILFV